MTDSERDALISEMNRLYDLSNKYAQYATACVRALPSLQSASGGATFLYDKQTPNVCGKVNDGIHPNQGLLNRLCLSRHELNTDIDGLTTTVESVYWDAISKSADYESRATSIMSQLQWG